MALGSALPLTEMSTRNLRGGKKRPARKADSFTAICEPIVEKMWEPRRLTTVKRLSHLYQNSNYGRVLLNMAVSAGVS
jgi:hypothetical protein